MADLPYANLPAPYERFVVWLFRRGHPQGWLVKEAVGELRHGRGIAWRFRTQASKLMMPTRASLIVLWTLFVVVALATWLLGNPSVPTGRLASGLSTIWQVQAAIAAIALPLLGLVIQLAGEKGQTAARTHEVLTRQSGVFPIACWALLGTA